VDFLGCIFEDRHKKHGEMGQQEIANLGYFGFAIFELPMSAFEISGFEI
jgi:hypothetical protein